jgi:polysaccharide export outer membrane protein
MATMDQMRNLIGARRSLTKTAWIALAIGLQLCAPCRAQEDYEIGPQDVLRIVVLGQAEMSGEMVVDSEGLLTFPVLGKVKASAMTTKELERKLTTLLADGYLKRPEVSVIVKEYRSKSVFVMGEVQRPGLYALKADRSLLALLSDIGTLSADAGHEVIVIRPPKEMPLPIATPTASPPPESSPEQDRTSDEEVEGSASTGDEPPAVPGSEVFHIDLEELRSGKPEANILLQAGDTVHFPRAAQIYVSGHVGRPGSYRYQRGMTLLQALTLAGGVTERGSSGRTRVMRQVEGKRKKVKVKLNDLVEPEDTIVVPERFF